ncbi:MAG TPA: carbohydrate-binding family 9-like protein [Candidatus Acidoferrum sp.]|jgi:alpha-galactosidase
MTNTATALHLETPIDPAAFPPPSAWAPASPIAFNTDWQGKNPDPQRETEVRLLWTPTTLYLRFHARFRNITVFPDAPPNGRRDHLWDRDVCEVFLQPNSSDTRTYKEFEVSPNSFWIDLHIAPNEKHDLQSGLRRQVRVDPAEKQWEAILAIPISSLVETENFDPAAAWKVNFYRVEGSAEPRFYSAWIPTNTPTPNFHVPQAFGTLIFSKPRAAQNQ